MANGDAALDAGMDILSGEDDRRNGWDEINKTRDYIATFAPAVTEIVNGGTGAQSAAQARINLGVQDAVTKVSEATASNTPNTVMMRNGEGKVSVSDPTGDENIANRRYVESRVQAILAAVADDYLKKNVADDYLKKTGGTVTGSLFLPNSSPATAGYSVAYINGDGRVSRNASSERYKKHISEVDPAELGDLFPQLVRYQMRGGDGTWKYGHIAERLDESDDQRPFVVYDAEGRPDSIDFIALLMVQNAQLHQAVELLTQRIDHLEGS